jgi:uncharacterized protein YbcC (UPF0753/DUF2309 family)
MARITPTRLREILHDVAHYLPAQAPLEVFVHHNTLHAYQKLSFHEALAAAFDKTGARGYLEEAQYREAHRRGRITDADVDAALPRWVPRGLPALPEGVPDATELCRLALLHDVGAETKAGLAWELTEHRADTHFPDDAPRVARNRIVRESVAWLEEELAARGPEAVARLLVENDPDPRRVADELEVRFGRRMTATGLAALLKKDGEAAAVASLWQAARRIAMRLEIPRVRAPRPTFPRDAVLAVGGEDPNDFVHPPLILLAGAFVDRGQALWAMPDREHGFFVAFRRVLGAGHAVRPSWLAGLGTRLRAWEAKGVTAEEAVIELLDELGIAERDCPSFIERKLLFLPGWAGMFHRLESAPRNDELAPLARLVDFLAVRLCLDELALVEAGRRLGWKGPVAQLVAHCATLPKLAPRHEGFGGTDERSAWPLFRLSQYAGLAAPRLDRLGDGPLREILELLARFDRRAHLRVWHEAYERRYRTELLGALAAPRAPAPTPEAARAQLVFCIDDRNESIRRHVEELSPAYATYGTAGFFNLAIAYQGIDDPATFPLCPVVVTPQHRISEEPIDAGIAEARRRRRRWASQASSSLGWASRSLVFGPIVISIVGLFTVLPLLATIFAPWIAGRFRRAAQERFFPSVRTRLSLPRVGVDAEGRMQTGFTIEEKATRVATLLQNIGLVRDFAPIVAVIGHHSSSVNNPHFAAYSCGACGGRSGGPNARLFARMANRPEVREVLRERGIDIPAGTTFVGGVHDTTTDRITFYDTEGLAAAALPALAELERTLAVATARNAHERCRKFSSEPKNLDPDDALRRVEARAWDLSQARPELGHATNAACVVGRRALTQGIFLDRRSFLVSYDPTIDADGAILERTLAAVGPVCAGINLEYFFSTTDRERWGAGTKLPHNVTGFVGVMNGAASDLRTGLPSQMIEVHEPIRLQLVVEARSAVVAAIVERAPDVAELVKNEWVVLVVVDPETRALSCWSTEQAAVVPLEVPAAVLPTVARSVDWYEGKAELLPPARIVTERAVRDVA